MVKTIKSQVPTVGRRRGQPPAAGARPVTSCLERLLWLFTGRR
jgi:hypothetical protein